MHLKSIELLGFKSFAQKIKLEFKTPISAIVGPNGSGKSNVAEAFRFVLGEQSVKSMRGKKGEDLIFNGSRTTPKSNRASVKLVFDNKEKILNLDYDEVILERIVHRDGTNQYFINKSLVRLKDIIELLSSANIGPTGHHIISQGESDRILSVNSKERKSMIEDALGLKIYFYKKKESVKKLEKTELNIKEAQSLRREIKPHLKFLKRQVDKIKNIEILKNKLKVIYKEYLKREKIYINSETFKIAESKKSPEQESRLLQTEIEKAEEVLNKIKPLPEAGQSQDENNNESNQLLKIKSALADLRTQEQGLIRDLGKLEGEILFLEKIKTVKTQNISRTEIPLSFVEDLNSKIEIFSREAEDLNDPISLREIITKIKDIFSDFISKNKKTSQNEANSSENNFKKHQELIFKKEEIEEKINLIKDREINLDEQYKKVQSEIENKHVEQIEAEKTILQIKARYSEIKSILSSIYTQEKILSTDKTRFEEEMTEAISLVGGEIAKYMDAEVSEDINENRDKQEIRRREVERIKIKLEDSGIGPTNEIFEEYKETSERDEFLEKEIEDLEKSKESLNTLVNNLDEKLNIEFKEGVKKINEEFSKFFSSMFGGGSSSIEVVNIIKKKYIEDTEEFSSDGYEDNEEGVEINISLPYKKIKGLDMLSGGERALTSIALTFAISQINPPPFVILDETDAALDESNSKKYGNIIEKLSGFSQLVLITHNRETMSRAGVLYGITMGSDGVSKTLSIELDDAVKIAK